MNIIEVLQKFENDTKIKYKTEVYIVGGYVRDLLRKKKNSDIDIVVRNVELNVVEKFLRDYGKTKKLTIHNVEDTNPITFILFKTSSNSTFEAQISTVKGPTKKKIKNINNIHASLKQDSNQRDFTINAMYIPINKISSKEVIDFWGGKNDIKGRQILSVGSAKSKFIQSPIRILRAFSLAARTKYTISHHVRVAISENAYLLKKLSGEAIKAELEEVLLSHKPSVYLKLMQKLGVLKVILPELDNCFNCKQDKKYHKYSVFNHLIYTCDNIESNIVLRLAGLLHDIGKPQVKNNNNGKITFYKHEVVGAKIATVILKRLRYDNETIDKVCHLIRMHMYHYTREYTDAGIRRFINNARVTEKDIEDISNFPLFKIRKAERLGNGFKKQAVTGRQKDFEERLVTIFKKSYGSLIIKDLLVDGNDLMKYFNLKPSGKIGEILKHLLEIVIEDSENNDKHILLHHALDFIIDEEGKHETN